MVTIDGGAARGAPHPEQNRAAWSSWLPQPLQNAPGCPTGAGLPYLWSI
jgi:hypothetical protein